jgi:hypothetical protein
MRYQNQSTHSNIMKHIIAFLLTVAFLSFSIVTGRAEQPTEPSTELPSGNYYLSLTFEDGEGHNLKNVPVRLTTKIDPLQSLASTDEGRCIKTDIVIECSELGNFVGHTAELYNEGKFKGGFIAVSMTKPMLMKEGGSMRHSIETFHLIGKISIVNHIAEGGGSRSLDVLNQEHYSRPYLSQTARLQWALRPQPQGRE